MNSDIELFKFGPMSQNYDVLVNATLPPDVNLSNIKKVLNTFYPGRDFFETTCKDVAELNAVFIPKLNNPKSYVYNGLNLVDYMNANGGAALVTKYNGLLTEKDFYRIEDNDLTYPSTISDYASFQKLAFGYFATIVGETFDPSTFNTIYTIPMKTFYMPATFKIKKATDRARPSVGSYRMNVPLTYQYTVSGPHPEFTSGHSIQGIFLGTLIYNMYKSKFDANPEALQLLARYALDCGYHRLIAGIHYPSTHLASIQLFLLLNSYTNYEPFWNEYYRQLRLIFPFAKFQYSV